MCSRGLLVSIVLSMFFLVGCSGHPGAGKWAAVVDENQSSIFASITIDFDGKASITPTDSEAPAQNCYWQASAEDSIAIQCGTADQDKGTLFYSLQVEEPNLAVLTMDDQVLGQFKRLP